MPGTANLAIYQGDDYAAVVTVSDGSGTPPNLTGYTAQAQVRLGPADTNPTVVVEIATSLLLPDQIQLTIPRSITAQLSGNYSWDLQLIKPDTTIETILAGKVQVTLEVTREVGNVAAVYS
jgi:hypothetical protein